MLTKKTTEVQGGCWKKGTKGALEINSGINVRAEGRGCENMKASATCAEKANGNPSPEQMAAIPIVADFSIKCVAE